MNRADMTVCITAALAHHEGYTQSDIDPEVIAEHNACAEAVVAALLDQYGQTQWALRFNVSGDISLRSGVGPAKQSARRRKAAGEDVSAVSRRVLPSIETEWEPAT